MKPMLHRIFLGKTYVQYTRIHCTACNCHLGSAIANFQDIFIHSLLKVLICKNCCEFYQSGDFVQDDDGTEKYCRWCGQGGTLVCCSKCPKVFCKVKINLLTFFINALYSTFDYRVASEKISRKINFCK